MATPALLTFGYEGLAIEAFIARLQAARVDLVVDVRQMPLSHKKGFSKTAFHAALEAQGIGYEHLPALGCPKPVRDRYHEDGDWTAFSHGYLAHLNTQKAAVATLAETVRHRRACLVCYEADPGRCHRTYVARAVAKQGGPEVIHLVGEGEIPDERLHQLERDGDELRIRPARRRLGNVPGKLAKFSSDFMAEGRGRNVEDDPEVR